MRIELDFDNVPSTTAYGDLAALLPPNEIQRTPHGFHFAYEIDGLPDWLTIEGPDDPPWWSLVRADVKHTLRDALAGTSVNFDPGAPLQNLRQHAAWQRVRADAHDVTTVIASADPRYRGTLPTPTPQQVEQLVRLDYDPGSRWTRAKCWRRDHTSGGAGRGTCVAVLPDGAGVYCWGQHAELDGGPAFIGAATLIAKLTHQPAAEQAEDATLNALCEWVTVTPDSADARRGALAVLAQRGWTDEQVRVWVAGARLERMLRDPSPRPRPKVDRTFKLYWDADLQRPAQYLADEGRLDPSITPTRSPDFFKQFPALQIFDQALNGGVGGWAENKAWVKSCCDGDVSRAIRMGMVRARCAPVPRLFDDTEWFAESQVPIRVLPPAVATRRHWTDAGQAKAYLQNLLGAVPVPKGMADTEAQALRLCWMLPALTETFAGAMPLIMFVGGTGAGKGVTVRSIQKAWRYHYAGDLMVGSPGEVDNRLLAGRSGGVWLLDELADDGGAAIDAKVLAHLKSVMTCEVHGVRIFHRQHTAMLRMNHAWFSTARSLAALANSSKIENDWRRRCVTVQFPQEQAKPDYVRQLQQFAAEFMPLDVAHALRCVAQSVPDLDERRRQWSEAWLLAMPGWSFIAGLMRETLGMELDAKGFDRLPVDNSPVEFFNEWWLSPRAAAFREAGKKHSFSALRDHAKDKREFRWAEKNNYAFDLQRATGGQFETPSDGNGTAPGSVAVYTNRAVEWRWVPKKDEGGGGNGHTPAEPLPVLAFSIVPGVTTKAEAAAAAPPESLPQLLFKRAMTNDQTPATVMVEDVELPLPKLVWTKPELQKIATAMADAGEASVDAQIRELILGAPQPENTNVTPDPIADLYDPATLSSEFSPIAKAIGDDLRAQAQLPLWTVDFESASAAVKTGTEKRDEADLRTLGAYRYWEAPNVEVTCMVAATRSAAGSHVVIWTPEPLDFTYLGNVREPRHLLDPHVWKHLPKPVTIECYYGPACPEPLLKHVTQGGYLTAHNAQFDARAWRRLGWDEPTGWNDTMHACRAQLGTGSLDDALTQLYQQGKADKPAVFLPWRSLSVPKRLSLVSYCASDAIPTLSLAHDLFKNQTADELEESRADFRMNDVGFGVDKVLCEGLVKLNNVIRDDIEAKLCAAVGITAKALNSPKQLTEFLGKLGLEVETVDARVMQEILDADEGCAGGEKWRWRSDPPVTDEDVAKALMTIEARLDFAGITGGKAARRLDEANTKDGRAHDQIQHRKARTGRSAGSRSQPQNDPRHELNDGQLQPILAAVRSGDLAELDRCATLADVTNSQALSACLRSTITAAPGMVLRRFDFEQIECRAVAWAAGQMDLLDAFRTGRDVYCEFGEGYVFRGEKLGKKTTPGKRTTCKIMVLAGGYQMGRARTAVQCRQNGIDLAALKLTPGRLNEAFRDAYPMISGKVVSQWSPKDLPAGEVPFKIRRGGLWNDLQGAGLRVAGRGAGYSEQVCGGRVLLANEGDAVVLTLPSGRRQIYPHASVEDVVSRWGGKPKPTFQYRWGGKTVDMYGGKWTENIASGMCYDLLAGAVRRLERELGDQVTITLTIHDEIVLERPIGALGEFIDKRAAEIISEVPAWAKGWPIGVEMK